MQGCISTCTEHFLHDFFLREKKSNDFKNVWRWNSGRQNSCFCCHIQGCLPISSWHFDSKRPRTDCGDLYQYLSAPKDSEDQEGALLYMLHDVWQSRGHESLLPAAIKELGRVRSTLEIPFKVSRGLWPFTQASVAVFIQQICHMLGAGICVLCWVHDIEQTVWMHVCQKEIGDSSRIWGPLLAWTTTDGHGKNGRWRSIVS